MEQEKMLMWYFIIGLVYAVYNGAVRKVETEGDFLLPMVWVLLWPLGFLSLTVLGISKLFNK